MSARSACAGALLIAGWALAMPAFAHAEKRAHQLHMLNAVNEVRAQHGVHAFHGAPRLHRSASSYARWMLRHGYFGHLARIRASGFRRLGENLSWHSGRRPAPRATVRRWLASPTHRALMLSPAFRWLGAGIAQGRFGGRVATIWVLHFGG